MPTSRRHGGSAIALPCLDYIIDVPPAAKIEVADAEVSASRDLERIA